MENTLNYTRIEKAIRFLVENYKQQPSLEEVAEKVNLSPFHFQRTFSEWAGVSPKKFMQYLTVEELKKELAISNNLTEAAEKVGLSAQSRVYDLFVHIEAVTPLEYKLKGTGTWIRYGVHESPFGNCFIASTERGICKLSFFEGDEKEMAEELKTEWPQAEITRDQEFAGRQAEQLFSPGKKDVRLILKGTPFQLKVWQALLQIPFGGLTTYGNLSKKMSNPSAARAVGTAVGSNPVAFLIPCHRVIRKEGIIGEYRWGSTRKAAIIGWEKANS